MPIVVQHQPSFVGVGQTAFRAGYGQFQQQQFQNSMAVMQMALQERARQQALANQQQAAYLGAQQDAADRQSRERMFMLQQNNQAAMNDADNRSRMQMELWQGQQQSQNYADLRDHQMQLAQFKAASSSAEYDKKARLDALGKATANVDTRGAQLASQLRSELGMITSARAAGNMTDQAFQSAMQAWDEKFSAQGDWSQFRADPAAQAKSKLASQQVEDPQWGIGQIIIDSNGNPFFMPRGPVFDEVKYPGMVGLPDPKQGIKWQAKEQPKIEKPPAPPKPPLDPDKLEQKAIELYEQFGRAGIESPKDFRDMAIDELMQWNVPGVTAPAQSGAEGEAPPQAGPQQQPGQAPQQQPQQQQGAPQVDAGMEVNEPPPSVQGEQERQQWQMMSQLPKTKPEYTQDAKDIQQLLSQGLPLTHPQVQSKVAGLASKIAEEAKKKGLVAPQKQYEYEDVFDDQKEPQQKLVDGDNGDLWAAPEQPVQQPGISKKMTTGKKPNEVLQKQDWDTAQEEILGYIESLNGEPVLDLIEYALAARDAQGVSELEKIRSEYDSGLINASQAAVRLAELAKRNPRRYSDWKQSRP